MRIGGSQRGLAVVCKLWALFSLLACGRLVGPKVLSALLEHEFRREVQRTLPSHDPSKGQATRTSEISARAKVPATLLRNRDSEFPTPTIL